MTGNVEADDFIVEFANTRKVLISDGGGMSFSTDFVHCLSQTITKLKKSHTEATTVKCAVFVTPFMLWCQLRVFSPSRLKHQQYCRFARWGGPAALPFATYGICSC